MDLRKKQTQIQRIKILEKVVGKLYMELIELKQKLKHKDDESE